MDIFSEMFATGGNIEPNRGKIPLQGSVVSGFAAARRKFMTNNEYILPVMEPGTKAVLCGMFC